MAVLATESIATATISRQSITRPAPDSETVIEDATGKLSLRHEDMLRNMHAPTRSYMGTDGSCFLIEPCGHDWPVWMRR